MLTVPQQATAALAYVKSRLADSDQAALLKDGEWVGRLNYHFVTIYGILTEVRWILINQPANEI